MAGEDRVFDTAAARGRRGSGHKLALAFAAACAMTNIATAADIMVEVTAEDGAEVAGVVVSATHEPTGANRWIVTGDDGDGELRGLDRGRWRLVFEHGSAAALEQSVELLAEEEVVLVPVALAAGAGDTRAGDAGRAPSTRPAATMAGPAPAPGPMRTAASPVRAGLGADIAAGPPRGMRNWLRPHAVGRAARPARPDRRGATGPVMADLAGEARLTFVDGPWAWLFACLATLRL